MKKPLQLLLIVCFSIIGTQLEAQNITCKLKGTIVNRNSNELLLVKGTEDVRFNSIKIPIIENHFEYELKVPVSEKYELIFSDEFNGATGWRPIAFFPENGTIEFTLHNMDEYLKNMIIGGELNKKMVEFEKQKSSIFNPLKKPFLNSVDSLRKSGKYLSEEATALFKEMGETKDMMKRQKLYQKQERMEKSGEMLSPEGKALRMKLDSITKNETKWQNDYIKENIDLHSLSLIYSGLRNYEYFKASVDLDFIKYILPRFSSKFATHPTMATIEKMFSAINSIKIGSKYIDFEEPTVNGKIVKVSEKINGKVALIDLWASWCGPCRALSISMIPIYEKYKDKGFTIIGVACEYKNLDDFKMAIERDKYPWLNLIELDNQNKIWEKYNVAGAGGKTFLVDSKGYIIAIHPTAEEVDKILQELLN